MHAARGVAARTVSTTFTSTLFASLLASGLLAACASGPCTCPATPGTSAATTSGAEPLAAAPPSAPAAAPPRASETGVPVRKRGNGKVIAEVGSAGGTLELDNGARLEIPAGALPETVEVTFAEGAKTTAFSNHDYEQPLGPTLEVTPELALGVPVKVSIPMSRLPEGFDASHLTLGLEVMANAQRGVQMHGTQTRWDYLPASSDHGRALAELQSVPGFRVQFLVSKSD
jgi:hypothetical protein